MSPPSLSALLLLLPALIAALTPYVEDFGLQRNCMITRYPPQKPLSLQFCTKFSENACCVPSQDAENMDFTNNMLQDRGLSCRIRGDLRQAALSTLYCMNCDPNQPRYMRNMAYVPMLTMEEYLWLYPLVQFPTTRSPPLPSTCFKVSTDGNRNVSLTSYFLSNMNNAGSLVNCLSTRGMMVLVSKQWMVDVFHIYPNVMSVFDTCLLYRSVPCLDQFGTILPNRDRFTCGKEIVNPSSFYGTLANQKALQYPNICQLNGLSTAPGKDYDCRVLYLERALNTDAFGTPQLDENFGFRLVDNRPCTDAEYNTWKDNYNATVNSADPYAINFHVLSGPTCLMTKAQAIDLQGLVGGAGTFDYFQDEMAFNSAAALQPALVAVLLVVLVVLLV